MSADQIINERVARHLDQAFHVLARAEVPAGTVRESVDLAMQILMVTGHKSNEKDDLGADVGSSVETALTIALFRSKKLREGLAEILTRA